MYFCKYYTRKLVNYREQSVLPLGALTLRKDRLLACDGLRRAAKHSSSGSSTETLDMLLLQTLDSSISKALHKV